MSEAKRKVGRPRVDATQLSVRMPPAELARLDDWIDSQPDPKPSRPEALRLLAGKAIGKKPDTERKKAAPKRGRVPR